MNELTAKLQGLEVKGKTIKLNIPTIKLLSVLKEPTAYQIAIAEFEKKKKAAQERSHRRNKKLRAMAKKQSIGKVHGKVVMKKTAKKDSVKKAKTVKKAENAEKGTQT